MGIINTTPDSFFSGSRQQTVDAVLKQGEQMVAEGAKIIEVGGYSTRPGADDISEDEELQRVIAPIAALTRAFPEHGIAVDTFRSEVARQAVQAGACLVNDVSGGELDPDMYSTVAALNVPYVLMHMRGNPRTMVHQTDYDDLLYDIGTYFHQRLAALREMGLHDVIIDPGYGFAKTIEQNFALLRNMDVLRIHDRPIMAGISRKSMIWKTLHIRPEEALNGTTAIHSLALLKGANILRVHDVREAVECIELFKSVHPF